MRHFRYFVNDNEIDLEFLDEKIDTTIGSSTFNAESKPKRPNVVGLTCPKHTHQKLEKLAEARHERISTTARKIIEYKVPNDPDVVRDSERIGVTIKMSDELRDLIDEKIEGTGMTHSAFLALQLSSYLSDVIEEEPAPSGQ